MYFKQILNERCGCASYVIACHSRDAVIVDPAIDIQEYESLLQARNLKLRYVIDTHVHATWYFNKEGRYEQGPGRGGKTKVVNGPYAETKEQLGGYYTIEAPDLDAALAWAARCPAASHGAVEVRPIWPM